MERNWWNSKLGAREKINFIEMKCAGLPIS